MRKANYARTKAEAELLALAARLGRDAGRGDPSAPRLGSGRHAARRSASSSGPAGDDFPLLNGGTALIDTTYIDNAATGIAAALDRLDHAHGKAYVLTNGEPRPVGELLAGICRAAGVHPPRWSIPAGLGLAAGVPRSSGCGRFARGADEPPMTRFLAQQLSTAHWFDQRETRRALDWSPSVSIDEGLQRLALSYAA